VKFWAKHAIGYNLLKKVRDDILQLREMKVAKYRMYFKVKKVQKKFREYIQRKGRTRWERANHRLINILSAYTILAQVPAEG